MSVQTAEGTKPSTSRLARELKWLYPGMGVKRWLMLLPLGLVPILFGLMVLLQWQAVDYLERFANLLRDTVQLPLNLPVVYVPLGLTLVFIGLLLFLIGAVGLTRSIITAIAPEHLNELPEVIHRKRSLKQGAKIVVIGGGTGLSTLLRGLKRYTSNLTAIVTMTDDGGSSGMLQRQLGSGVLPPGDIRNCLVALADAEPLMQQLFQYRFTTRKSDDGLSGHNFGNLLIAAMADITGDFQRAVEETSSILAIRGRVMPSTVESVILVGTMADGREISGETNIAHDAAPIARIKLCPERPRPLPEVIAAIADADVILMGPGSVYTSVVPNLLVPEIAMAVSKATALKVYICNVMTQHGETDGYTASDHVRAVEQHAQTTLGENGRVFDYVLVNSAMPSEEVLARYDKTSAQFVIPDVEQIAFMGYHAVKGSFISEDTVVRHDPDKLAKAIQKLWSGRLI